MSSNNICFISIGSNIGNKEHYIEQAKFELSIHPGIGILKESVNLFTKALEITNQPDFLNTVIKIRTSLSENDLLETLQGIEFKLGRIRRYDKGPREIDLDILTYGNRVQQSKNLHLPHHSLFTRPFIRKLICGMGEESLYSLFREENFAKHH
ncbi:MAG: 2-amino-4-hydroxy-6-hydroxymethyldihydropteridine diphosphokinase [Leptospira sp.]|nr:2-amino-4-hydroxy-6-hydroxymethyldihydropteridine diphosphokinase [Leptospira sp.]